MKKSDKLRAFREALKQAQETINFYKGYIKTAEDLEEKDISELSCLGSFFYGCPNNGYEPSEEEQREWVEQYTANAERRAKKEAEKRAYNKEWKEQHTKRFYAVKFFEKGKEKPLVSMLVKYMGKANDLTALEIVWKDYPQYKGKDYKVEALSEAEYIASKVA